MNIIKKQYSKNYVVSLSEFVNLITLFCTKYTKNNA